MDDGRTAPPIDGTAWASFVAHYDDILGYLRSRLGHHDAADVAQEALLRACQRTAEEPVERPRAYLFRAARTALIDHLRHAQHRRHAGLDEDAAIACVSASPDPHAVLEQRERLELVRGAIAALPPKCREVFILHRMGGLSQDAIAERLGISASTVEKHIMRALRSCSASLRDR